MRAKERREMVVECLRKNMSETRIAKELGFHRQTIVRDVADLKKDSQNWLDGLAKNGFIFECRMTLDIVKNTGARLEELYNNVDNSSLKLAILEQIDRNAKLHLELLGETPTIHAYREAMQMITRNVSQT